MANRSVLQVFEYPGEGYSPLVFSHDWQTAILNWEVAADSNNLHEIERHNLSDEVFILWRGKGALVIKEEDGLKIVDAIPGTVYNVPMGTWHTVIGDQKSSWIIVENRDTHIDDTEMLQLSDDEIQLLRSQLPGWADGRKE